MYTLNCLKGFFYEDLNVKYIHVIHVLHIFLLFINYILAKIFCNGTCPTNLRNAVTNLFSKKLKLRFEIDNKEIHYEDGHLFIICCERSRLIDDIEEVVEKLHPRYARM